MNRSPMSITPSRLSYGLVVSCLIPAGLLLESPCRAANFTFQITGTMGAGPSGAWPENTPFTATYTFDSDTASNFNSYDSMTYYQGAIQSLSMAVGDYQFSLGSGLNTIRVGDNLYGGSTDLYILQASFDPASFPNGYEWGGISFQFNGPPSVLNGVALPTSASVVNSLVNHYGTTVYLSLGNSVAGGTTSYGYTDTVSAVPEPSTYAMALAGLACGGFSMWRRRKRA